VDPFSLLLLAQGAVSAIKQGVDFLHQGRIALESTKKTVDGVVADVKAIKNIFDWFIGLFISKPKAETAKPVAKTAAKSKPSAAKEKSYQQLESELIRDIGENLGLLFDTQQQINTYYEELEEDSKTNYDPTQNTSKKAIQRVIIQLELEKLMEATREAMVYSPPECKDMYSRFLLMYGKIEQEQKWARAEMIRRARLARWRKEQDEIRQIELISGGVAVTFISLFFGWFMWAIQNLYGGY
jgi:actin-like ATPase involved in cell morphogenesis